jgi:membrane-bound lytic murein transglycosylase D
MGRSHGHTITNLMKRTASWSAGLMAMTLVAAGEPASKDQSPPAPGQADELYELGRNLFEALAPEEVKEEFEFPDREQWDAFVQRLQAALDGTDPAALAEFETEARAALAMLRLVEGGEDYVDWLEERLDYIEAAQETVRLPPTKPVKPVKPPKTPTQPPARPREQAIPGYDLWLRRVQARTPPPAAAQYASRLKPIFAAGGVPGELVWLAEVESTFNPTARSPAGARGLFQLMPATAKELGLSTVLPDERTNPDKSAAAAAKMLRGLHAKFGDWPLALAAYNAGPGRVQRTLDKHRAKTFAEIATALPVETRNYVPKVLAVLKVRSGLTLAGPGRR